ncbi:fimbrial protein [Achromobacter spanius]|uniref:fimbrial protein n=1 Tax=Achromobacter spanius TaxID=217203 RepID=UPI0037F64355
MKLKTLAFSAAALVGIAAAMPASAQALGTGKVNFTGELIEDTCEVTTETADQRVPLPKVSVQSLNEAGLTAGSTPFDIEVVNCPATLQNVAVHFEMTNMEAANRTLKNMAATDAAGNVSVQLIEADGTVIRAGSTGAAYPITGTGAARGAKMTYGGQYYALAPTTPGLVQTFAEFTIAYP